MIELPWIAEARKHIGQKEIPGPANNSIILNWFKSIDAGWFKEDSVPWCAAFVGGCLEAVGIKSTRSARALSYSDYGQEMLSPAYGSIAVKERRNATGRVIGGHVTFVVGITPYNALICLGGNQGDAVNEAVYPARTFVTFRWPVGDWPVQPLPVIRAASGGEVKEA